MWKILIVDDNFINRQLLIEMLREYAVCDSAASGREAVDAYNASIETEKYDLILLDIAMPEMNGLEFLKVLRHHEQMKGIYIGDGMPVIMVTGYKEWCMDAFASGCDDYIVKPIERDILIRKIIERLGEPRDHSDGALDAKKYSCDINIFDDIVQMNSRALRISPDAYQQIVRNSIVQNMRHIQELAAGINTRDCQRVEMSASLIKTTYENLLLPDVSKSAGAIELLATQRRLGDEMHECYEKLSMAFERLQYI